MSWLRNELNAEKYELGLVKKKACTAEESKILLELEQSGKPIPGNVFKNELDDYCRYVNIDADTTNEDIQTYCALKQMRYIKTIRNCVVFFTVCAIVYAILYALWLPNLVDHFKEVCEEVLEILDKMKWEILY